MRRLMFALVVGASVLAAGCGDDKKNDPKPPAGADLKPLAPPPAPGGANPGKAPAKQPGGGVGSQ